MVFWYGVFVFYNNIEKLFQAYVRGTAPHIAVVNAIVIVGALPSVVAEKIGIRNPKIYITTKIVKHLYDKRPAEEFDCIIANLPWIIQYPEEIYRDKAGKTGSHCLVRAIRGERYLCPLDANGYVVTTFRIRDEKYLKEYELLRSWRDGAHSS